MTADTLGGVWHYALDLARGLGARGVELHLATMGAPLTPDQHRAGAAIESLTLHESAFRLEWMQAPWDEVARAGEWLLGLAERLAPDLIHLNGYSHGNLPWPAPVLVVGHSCVLSWWQAVHGEAAPAEWERYRQKVAAGLHAADRVVAPSRAMLSAIETHYGPLPQGQVIHNGRDPGAYRPAAKEPWVFAAGRLWDEAKNIRTAARAARNFRWPLKIAGERHHPEGGEIQLENGELLGLLAPEEIAGRYARAALFLHPARYEPFGLSAVEAGLSGCALVLGDIPSLRELWEGAALFVPPEEEGAITFAINRLAAEPIRREALARRARTRAHAYTLERTVVQYDHLYRTLASRDAARSDNREVERERKWTKP